MSGRRGALDRLAERVMDLDSPAYGDEREKAVSLEASGLGLRVAFCAGMVGSLVAAVTGHPVVAVALLVMVFMPAGAAVWYARRRGVDLQQLLETAGTRSAYTATVLYGAGTTLTFTALTYLAFAGRPLLRLPEVEVVPGEGFVGGFVQGGAAGGVVGGLATVVAGVLGMRRAAHRSASSGDGDPVG
ncbi:hypothetical protein ACFP6A_09270 [Quadrisphaera sp. GCM10027208]|uniref:hypothetical protein n=1 Tax=Quadrisphaera sp. GCM10027208 TaxID=3273423 RepID=UPI0036103495